MHLQLFTGIYSWCRPSHASNTYKLLQTRKTLQGKVMKQ